MKLWLWVLMAAGCAAQPVITPARLPSGDMTQWP